DGNVVLDESSLFVNAPLPDEEPDISQMEVIDESAGNVRVTSASFAVNKIRGKRWASDDEDLFYKCLQYFGTNFELISHMFPNITRRHIKMKYNSEERARPAKITWAL
ncbi:hypothetical protein BCR33DRAFT_633590, partial [Rhizoclosmatium globosum]